MRLILSPGELIRLKVWRCERWFKRGSVIRAGGGRAGGLDIFRCRASVQIAVSLFSRAHTHSHTPSSYPEIIAYRYYMCCMFRSESRSRRLLRVCGSEVSLGFCVCQLRILSVEVVVAEDGVAVG